MRRQDREITDKKEIEAIIKRAAVCRLALLDGDQPYIVPLNFGHADNALYFHWATEGRKIDLVKKNNKVCFEIDIDFEPVLMTKKACGGYYCTGRYRSVIGAGRAYILEDEKEKVHGLEVLVRHYYAAISQPYTEGEANLSKLDSVLVVKVEIDSLTGKKSGY